MPINRVYVGNLSYRTTWYELKDYMRTAGDVAHAKILTLHHGQSRGCGLVEFATPEDAQRAIDELDGTELLGRTIFVREDRTPPEGNGSHGHGNHAGNGSHAGNGGRAGSSGHAGPKTSADAADPSSDASILSPPSTQDSTAFAPPSASSASSGTGSRSDNSEGAPEHKGFALFVGNLPYSVNWSQLKQIFSAAGEVVRADVHLAMHRSSRGHGTVVFATAEDAQNAIRKFNGYLLEGRVLEVREDKPASERPVPFLWCSSYGEPSETVHIANLPWATTESDLVELFRSVGPLSRACLQTFPDGQPNGNGVVRYENAEDAQNAVTQLNKYNYGSRELLVTFARYPVKLV